MNGETVVLSQDHNRIMRAVKRKSRLWHGAFHLCGIILLAAALLWPLVSKQKLDLVTEAFRLVKAEIGQYRAREKLLVMLRTKNLTVSQAMDVCDTIMAQKEIPVSMALALFETESNFNPDAVSKEGARGLGQLHGATAKAYAGDSKIKVHDPITNVRGSLQYLADLKNDYGKWPEALRSYNGGPSNRHNKSLDGYVKTVLARAEKYQKELE